MSKRNSIRRHVAVSKWGAAVLFAGTMVVASGCGDLGVGPVTESTSDMPSEVDEASSTGGSVLASVTLRDGSKVEFVDLAGGIVVTAEFDAKTADPLGSLNEQTTSLVGLYENLAGTPAPQALLDAEQRLQSGDRTAMSGMQGAEGVEPKSGDASPTISMSASAFQGIHCASTGFCLTNRVSSVTVSRSAVLSARGAVDCVAGKVTVAFSEKLIGPWQFTQRFVRDVSAGKTFTFAAFYLLPTDVRLTVVPQPIGTYHLALR